jgi:hypothetical protein
VRPRRVDRPTAAVAVLPGAAPADRGHRVVGQFHQMEVVRGQWPILECRNDHLEGSSAELALEQAGERGRQFDCHDVRAAVEERGGGLTGPGADLGYTALRADFG